MKIEPFTIENNDTKKEIDLDPNLESIQNSKGVLKFF